MWWDGKQKKWTGYDSPDFTPDKPPDYKPPRKASGPDALTGREPFIVHPDGLGWLYAPAGLVDGPLPAHYEPQESPFDNPLYSQRANPRRQQNDSDVDPYNPVGSELYPYVVTTYGYSSAPGSSATGLYGSSGRSSFCCRAGFARCEYSGLSNGDSCGS